MKAAILKTLGSPLAIETVPEPVLGTGEVIVDVMASRVLAYANEVLSGERKYLMELPIVPGVGAIGRFAPPGRMRPVSGPATGSIAIQPYVRATMRAPLTSSSRD